MKVTGSRYVPALRLHRLTPWYDAVVRTTIRERTFKQALIEQAAFRPEHRVLDVGCGTGTLAIRIKEQYPNLDIVGLDVDAEILRRASIKAQRADASVSLLRALSDDLPLAAEGFDRVVSSLLFHHLSWEAKKRTGLELFRILKPGGALHVADWGPANNALMRSMFLFIQLLDGLANTQDNVSGRLVTLLQQCGFVEVEGLQSWNTVFGTIVLYRAVKPE